MNQNFIDKHIDEIADERGMIVAKSNALIQKSRFPLSLQEQKIVLFLISKIKPTDKDIEAISLSISDFCAVCGIDTQKNKSMTAYIKGTIKTLADRSLWIETEEKKEILFRWIEQAEINRDNVTIKLHSSLKPYLIELKRQYTTYSLFSVLAMKSKYSVRLYELLKSYAFIEHKRFSIEELKIRLGAEKYRDFYKFKTKVLVPALNDIEHYSDIKVKTHYEKTKNKFTGVLFFIKQLEEKEHAERWENVLDKIDREAEGDKK